LLYLIVTAGVTTVGADAGAKSFHSPSYGSRRAVLTLIAQILCCCSA